MNRYYIRELADLIPDKGYSLSLEDARAWIDEIADLCICDSDSMDFSAYVLLTANGKPIEYYFTNHLDFIEAFTVFDTQADENSIIEIDVHFDYYNVTAKNG